MYSVTMHVVDEDDRPVSGRKIYLEVTYGHSAVEMFLPIPLPSDEGYEGETDSDGDAEFEWDESDNEDDPGPEYVKFFVGSEEYGPYEFNDGVTYNATV